ncbi:MAG: NusG domain II-containing protein [Desulfuromonadaceae bacterium]|nr:NusG domain II-containing protein [Desulfuromonadaceae bacterium]MDD5106214.1 NusG domain II-containing protein [Desulfuromonadaceae bacterium]
MTRADKILLAGLLLISLLSVAVLYGRFSIFPAKAEPVQAVITAQGKLVRKIYLTEGVNSSLVIQGRVGPATVEVDGTRIRMMGAPCTGQVCVKEGWIGRPGQTIVCMPGEILIRIEGAAPVDAVTR